MSRKNVCLLALMAFIVIPCVSSCSNSSSEETIQTAIAQTEMAQPASTNEPTKTPEPTSTPRPIADIIIEADTISPEDLGLQGGLILRTNPGIWPLRSVKDGDNHFSFELLNSQGDYSGWVSVFLFESDEELSTAFKIIQINVDNALENPQFGEIISSEENALVYQEAFKGAAYIKCNAIIHIMVKGKTDIVTMEKYAERLIDRLAPIVCQ